MGKVIVKPKTSPAAGERSGRRVALVVLAAAVVLAALGIGGVVLIGVGPAQAAKLGARPPAGAVGTFAVLPRMDFALADGARVRQLSLTVTLELDQLVETKEISARLPRVTWALANRINDLEPGELAGPEGTERIKAVVGLAANRELKPLHVRHVLLQRMVMN